VTASYQPQKTYSFLTLVKAPVLPRQISLTRFRFFFTHCPGWIPPPGRARSPSRSRRTYGRSGSLPSREKDLAVDVQRLEACHRPTRSPDLALMRLYATAALQPQTRLLLRRVRSTQKSSGFDRSPAQGLWDPSFGLITHLITHRGLMGNQYQSRTSLKRDACTLQPAGKTPKSVFQKQSDPDAQCAKLGRFAKGGALLPAPAAALPMRRSPAGPRISQHTDPRPPANPPHLALARREAPAPGERARHHQDRTQPTPPEPARFLRLSWLNSTPTMKLPLSAVVLRAP